MWSSAEGRRRSCRHSLWFKVGRADFPHALYFPVFLVYFSGSYCLFPFSLRSYFKNLIGWVMSYGLSGHNLGSYILSFCHKCDFQMLTMRMDVVNTYWKAYWKARLSHMAEVGTTAESFGSIRSLHRWGNWGLEKEEPCPRSHRQQRHSQSRCQDGETRQQVVQRGMWVLLSLNLHADWWHISHAFYLQGMACLRFVLHATFLLFDLLHECYRN